MEAVPDPFVKLLLWYGGIGVFALAEMYAIAHLWRALRTTQREGAEALKEVNDARLADAKTVTEVLAESAQQQERMADGLDRALAAMRRRKPTGAP